MSKGYTVPAVIRHATFWGRPPVRPAKWQFWRRPAYLRELDAWWNLPVEYENLTRRSLRELGEVS